MRPGIGQNTSCALGDINIVWLLPRELWFSDVHMYVSNMMCSCTCYSTGPLSVSVGSTSATSVTISWTLDDSVTATSYTISYSNTNVDCFTESYNDIRDITETMYKLTGLQEATEYSITVTAIRSDGDLTATTMATTMAAG